MTCVTGGWLEVHSHILDVYLKFKFGILLEWRDHRGDSKPKLGGHLQKT